jgi:putative lipoprotein
MIRALRFCVGFLLVLSMPMIATTASAAPKARVTGTAAYRERVALPPNAEFEASLVEVSGADRSALVIGHVRKNRLGQAPIAFSISYDPRDIHRRGRYVVRATITERGRVRFTGSEPALTHGHGNNVAILLKRVGGGNTEPPPPNNGTVAGLTESRWVPARILDRDVTVSGREREPWMELDSHTMRVTGSGGCNRFSGTFEVGRGSLRFGPLVSTKMACMSMETEVAFSRALDRTRLFRIRGRTLDLIDDTGRVLVRLEARNLR